LRRLFFLHKNTWIAAFTLLVRFSLTIGSRGHSNHFEVATWPQRQDYDYPPKPAKKTGFKKAWSTPQAPVSAQRTPSPDSERLRDVRYSPQRARGRRCELAVRVLEVYCDDVFALVPARAVERGGKPVPVEIGLVHGRNGTLVPEPLGVPPVAVATEEAFYALYAEASAARRVRSTQLNDYSSQSHFIVQLFVTTTDDATELCGVLTLVDLAGSERIKQSGVEGVGRKRPLRSTARS